MVRSIKGYPAPGIWSPANKVRFNNMQMYSDVHVTRKYLIYFKNYCDRFFITKNAREK